MKFRCTADRENLDEGGLPRTLEYAEALVQAYDAQDLWDDFGMVRDLVVSASMHSQMLV